MNERWKAMVEVMIFFVMKDVVMAISRRYACAGMLSMERRVRWKSHARCGPGEKLEIASKAYLSVSLILQTLQQLKDVYGDSVDKIVQGNTSNIIFLKSTDWDAWPRIKCEAAMLVPRSEAIK